MLVSLGLRTLGSWIPSGSTCISTRIRSFLLVFTPSLAKNIPTAAIGVKIASVDVFGTASEESDSSDDEGDRVEPGPQQLKKQEKKPVVANGDAKPATRDKPLKEKPI